MENIPLPAIVLFGLVTIFTIWQFFKATHKSPGALAVIIFWMITQAVLGLNGFYKVTGTIPPRFLLLIGPGLLFSFLSCVTTPGKKFLDNLDIQSLTLIHIARLPVEVVLYFVFSAGLIPELMTFEGYNFDIFSGISAPFIYYFVFVSKRAGKKLLLVWNVACLVLLTNIVTIALLSAKTPLQQFAFDQPNIGVNFFPLIFLPAIIVPVVLVSHLAAIRQLLVKKTLDNGFVKGRI